MGLGASHSRAYRHAIRAIVCYDIGMTQPTTATQLAAKPGRKRLHGLAEFVSGVTGNGHAYRVIDAVTLAEHMETSR